MIATGSLRATCVLFTYTFYLAEDEATQAHGPHEGGGHFLFLSGISGPDGDYTGQISKLESPTYQDSASECHISFFHYINGDLVNSNFSSDHSS